MATKGTPNEGFDNVIAARIYTPNTLELRCYVNTPDSLGQTSVFADLTEPTGTGYGPILLNGVYTSTNGVILYDHGTPDDPYFENTEPGGGSNWSQAVTGVVMCTAGGGTILHFNDYVSPVTMTPGKKLSIDISSLVAP